MAKLNKKIKDFTVGFFPNFFSLGETIPLLKIARLYQEMGGNIVLFSHGGEYEYFSKEVSCEVIKLKNFSDTYIELVNEMLDKKTPFEKLFFQIYEEESLKEIIKEETTVFKKNKISLLVSSFNLSAAISSKAINIPLVTLVSGTMIPPYYKAGNATFPDNYENILTRYIPSIFKNKCTKWFLLNNKMLVKNFNTVGQDYNIPVFKKFDDILLGDHSLVCDDIHILDVKPDDSFPLESFTGPIYGPLTKKKQQKIDDDILDFLNQDGKKILLNMGQGCKIGLFLKILSALSKTKYKVIAIRPGFKDEDVPHDLYKNILFRPFIPDILKVNKQVDLSIIHGGRGTTYTSILAGKPIIGIPVFIEQQYNIENIVRKKAGIRISKKFFTEDKLMNSVNTIFDNYDFYLYNIQKMANSISTESGEEKAAKRLIEIVLSQK